MASLAGRGLNQQLRRLFWLLLCIGIIMLIVFSSVHRDLVTEITELHTYDEPSKSLNLSAHAYASLSNAHHNHHVIQSKQHQPQGTKTDIDTANTSQPLPSSNPVSHNHSIPPKPKISFNFKPITIIQPYQQAHPHSHMYTLYQNQVREKQMLGIIRPQNPHCSHHGKVFAIGLSRTGTTTMSAVLDELGYKCRKKKSYEIACGLYPLWDWYKDFSFPLLVGADDISWFFHASEFFNLAVKAIHSTMQTRDLPWSFLYPVFDAWYPNSKYILTVRSSTHDLMNSEMGMRAHAQSKRDMKRKGRVRQYTYKNWVWPDKKIFGNATQTYMLLARRYEKHTENVKQYFTSRNRLDQLLILDLDKESNSRCPWCKITDWLGCGWQKYRRKPLPVHNARNGSYPDFFPKNYTFDWKSLPYNFYPPKYERLFRTLDNKSFVGMNDAKWKKLYDIYDPYYFEPKHPMMSMTLEQLMNRSMHRRHKMHPK